VPPVIQWLIIANGAVFLLETRLAGPVLEWFALWPPASGLFMPWQLLSYGFLHGSLTHLAFNMFGLWMFGSDLERVWGSRRLLAFFLICVLCAGVTQLAVTTALGSAAPTVGASGGLFGLLLGFAMVFPQRTITLLLPPIPMPAWLFVTGYGVVELVLGVTGTASGVAHFAHLGGLFGGWCVIRYWRGQAPFRRRRR
jgi:membrane associated rhomboid family serine protease